MYCPICGQQQISEQTRFCSRCGFVMTGVAEVIANNGLIPFRTAAMNAANQSPRRKGVKQGAFLMLLCLLLTPMAAIFIKAIGAPDELITMVAILTFMGGLLRIFYALMFESSTASMINALQPAQQNQVHAQQQLNTPQNFAQTALPPQSANFNTANSVYVPPTQQQQPLHNWRGNNTNELITPPSVTEDTTKLLDNQ